MLLGFFAEDSCDGNGLELEKNGPIFSSSLCVDRISINRLWVVLPLRPLDFVYDKRQDTFD